VSRYDLCVVVLVFRALIRDNKHASRFSLSLSPSEGQSIADRADVCARDGADCPARMRSVLRSLSNASVIERGSLCLAVA
jgi:hypothetical protein